MSSRPVSRGTLVPQRRSGRQRVEALLAAAGEVFALRGFTAATMAEVAARAEANIGSLYRFFPNKDALADALLERDLTRAEQAYDAAEVLAPAISTGALADLVLNLMVDTHDDTKALSALMDAGGQTEDRLGRLRTWALEHIGRLLCAHSPSLDIGSVEDLAILLLNGMKLMAAMTIEHSAPSSPGAVEELRAMFRLYLADRLHRSEREDGCN